MGGLCTYAGFLLESGGGFAFFSRLGVLVRHSCAFVFSYSSSIVAVDSDVLWGL